MAAASRYNIFPFDLMRGYHQLHAAGHVVKAMLTNAAITATNAVKADLAEITAQNGYTAGGVDIQNDITQATNVCNMTGVDVTITASGGSFGPWRSWSLYNSTQTTPLGPLMLGYDYGSSNTTNTSETTTLDFGSAIIVLTAS